MSKRVLKWSVTVDDQVHTIGGGRVVLVASQYGNLSVEVWTEEAGVDVEESRQVRVFGTGHNVPDDAEHIGSCIAGPFVWHVYEVAR